MRNALLIIAATYLFGVILGNFLFYSIIPSLAFAAASLALAILFTRRAKVKRMTLLISILPLFAGIALVNLHSYPSFSSNHVVNYAKNNPMRPLELEGIVTRPSEKMNDYTVLYLKLVSIKIADQKMPSEGTVRVIAQWQTQDLAYGDRVLLTGARLRLPRGYWNPGSFNYQAFMARREIYAAASLRKDGDIKVINKGKTRNFLSLLYSFKKRSAEAIEAKLPPREAAILKALVLGDTGSISKTDRNNYSRSGTAHLLSVSGLHIGFVAIASYYTILLFLKGVLLATIMLRRATFHARRWAALSSIFPVIAYATMVGDRPPAIRSAIMVTTYLVARFLGRDKNLYNSLALAALVILIWRPLSILDTGFQLSFLAVFFIIHYVHKAKVDFRAVNSLALRTAPPSLVMTRVKHYAIISIVATLATSPVIALAFNQLSLNAPAVNVFAIPLSSVIIPAGLLASMVNMVNEAVAGPLFLFSSLLTYILNESSSFFASASPLSFIVLTPYLPAVVAYYILLTFAIGFWRRRGFRLLLAGAAAAMAISVGAPYLRPHADGMLRVTFLDVGEGDAAVVHFPEGKVMIIDTGPSFRNKNDTGEMVIAPFLRKQGFRRIDYLIISHAQLDHAGGAHSLLRQFKVTNLWDNGSDITRYLHEGKENRKFKSPLYRLSLQDSLPSFYIDGVKVTIMHPPASYADNGKEPSENDRSVVVRLSYGTFSVLFTGDIEHSGQKGLLERRNGLNATVLKIPHHGSSKAMHPLFLSTVAPEVAVVSAGKYNRFGHPHPATLAAYSSKGIKTYRTDNHGAVSIASDGLTYSVKPFVQTMRPNDARRQLNH